MYGLCLFFPKGFFFQFADSCPVFLLFPFAHSGSFALIFPESRARILTIFLLSFLLSFLLFFRLFVIWFFDLTVIVVAMCGLCLFFPKGFFFQFADSCPVFLFFPFAHSGSFALIFPESRPC